jgi:hypothetical protein
VIMKRAQGLSVEQISDLLCDLSEIVTLTGFDSVFVCLFW